MSPIQGLSERERFPRLGKIHLGIRHPEKGYPMKTDYFVLPKDSPAYNDLIKLFSEKPKELRVMIPAEDEEMWASQYLKAYDLTHGLVCKGDGITATRLVDVKTQKWPSKDATATTMIDMPCPGTDCQDYKAKKCGEQMNLQVIIPEVPGLGVWQIDTGSKNSIININSCAKIIKMAFGRLTRIPLTLSLESVEVKNPENGKRQTVYVLNLRANVTLAELASSAKALDKSLLLTSPEFEAQLTAQTERDIEELFGEKPVNKTTGELKEPPPEEHKEAPKPKPKAKGIIPIIDPDKLEVIGEVTVKGLKPEPAPIPQPAQERISPAKIAGDSMTGVERLMANVRKAKPALKTDKNIRDWLVVSLKIKPERIDSEPEKVWQEVSQML